MQAPALRHPSRTRAGGPLTSKVSLHTCSPLLSSKPHDDTILVVLSITRSVHPSRAAAAAMMFRLFARALHGGGGGGQVAEGLMHALHPQQQQLTSLRHAAAAMQLLRGVKKQANEVAVAGGSGMAWSPPNPNC